VFLSSFSRLNITSFKRCLIYFFILFSKNKYIKVKDIDVKRVWMRERIGD
jgi:hypothetical protein